MSENNCYPSHLARAVHTELAKHGNHRVAIHTLESLFEVMYFTSLKTEEREPISFHIVYANPSYPDPNPPQRRRMDRWMFIKFHKPIPFTITNVLKIAKASDPRTSSFAVYQHNRSLILWGLVDQGNRYNDYINFEATSAYARPGLFQASIAGVGHIVTYIGTTKVAELKINSIVNRASDVLRGGPILHNILPGITNHVTSVKNKLPPEVLGKHKSRNDSFIAQDYIIALCRLLLRIQNYHHGGAILITPDNSYHGLSIKYRMNYSRLCSALHSNSCLSMEHSFLVYDGKNVTDRWLRAMIVEGNLDDSRSELDGTIWFISLLSKVDGLILMNQKLEVRGYGVEIIVKNEPKEIYSSSSRGASPSSMKLINYDHFGTRHRSMMRYCNKVPGSVGFVISQDGDVRAITSVKGKIVIWDNIRLQLHDFIKDLPKGVTIL
jgi:hypothetical protein